MLICLGLWEEYHIPGSTCPLNLCLNLPPNLCTTTNPLYHKYTLINESVLNYCLLQDFVFKHPFFIV